MIVLRCRRVRCRPTSWRLSHCSAKHVWHLLCDRCNIWRWNPSGTRSWRRGHYKFFKFLRWTSERRPSSRLWTRQSSLSPSLGTKSKLSVKMYRHNFICTHSFFSLDWIEYRVQLATVKRELQETAEFCKSLPESDTTLEYQQQVHRERSQLLNKRSEQLSKYQELVNMLKWMMSVYLNSFIE